MTLTEKENSLLKDLKSQEQLCIEKYKKYAEAAHDMELKNLFEKIRTHEERHLETICQMMQGNEVQMPAASPSATASKCNCAPSTVSATEKENDCYLCKDALSMEKHVSGVYNTGIFEFRSPVMRDTLAHIQKEEQNHGEMLYSYMSCNNMYS